MTADLPPARGRLLLVSGNLITRGDLLPALEADGYAVESVATCLGALQKLERHAYAWVILDERLADGAGLDILRTVHIPFTRSVLLTAGALAEDLLQAATNLGVTAVIQTPVHLPVFRGFLRRPLRICPAAAKPS